MKTHNIKDNPGYVAKVVTGAKEPLDEPLSKKKIIFIGLGVILTILIITPIAEYAINKEKSMFVKILLHNNKPNKINPAEPISNKEKNNVEVLSQLTTTNNDLKNQRKKLSEQLKKQSDELNNKNKEIITLKSENSKLSIEISSIKTELFEIKERKKKLDTYTKNIIEKKSTVADDMKKMIKFKVDAEKRKLEKEKKKILVNLNKKEKELEELKIYVAELKSYKTSSKGDSSSNVDVSDLKNKFITLKENMHYNSGTFYEDLNMFDEAVEEYKKAIAINPKASDAHYNVAVIYDLQIKDKEKALLHYKKYLELDPELTDIANVKAWIKSIEEKIK